MSELKNKISELWVLAPGDKFEVVGLEESFRKLTVVNISDCSVGVSGESSLDEKIWDEELGDFKKIWRTMGLVYFSCKTPVRKLEQ